MHNFILIFFAICSFLYIFYILKFYKTFFSDICLIILSFLYFISFFCRKICKASSICNPALRPFTVRKLKIFHFLIDFLFLK